MYWLLYIAFLSLAGGMVAWGLLKRERFLQYPTIAGATWLSFFALPVFAAIRDPSKYSQRVLDDGGLYLAMIMLVLCSGLGWLGYARGVKSSRVRPNLSQLSVSKVFWGGAIAYLIGFCSAFKRASVLGGFAEQFTGGAYYGSGLSGDFVKYNLLVPLINLGFVISFFATVRRFTMLRLWIILLMLPYPLATAIFLGRRSQTGTLAAGVLLSFMFVKGWHVPRIVFVLLICMMPLVVYYGGAYRSASQYGIDVDSITDSIRNSQSIDRVLAGEYSEFDVAVYYCAAAWQELAFNYGASLHNSIIYSYVPRQIVGESIKNSLYINTDIREAVLQRYSWSRKHGSFATGPCDVFMQFAFFGALYYYVIGYLYGYLWNRAYGQHSLWAQLWYLVAIYWMIKSIVSSITGVLPLFMYTFVFMYVLTRFCREREFGESTNGPVPILPVWSPDNPLFYRQRR